MFAKSFFAISFICAVIGWSSPSVADDKEVIGKFIDDLGQKALVIISDKSNSIDQRRQKLEDLFQKNVDIDWVGKFVLGRSWRDATDKQKADYITNYKRFILSHYTSNLTQYTDANFEVTRVLTEERGGNVVTVRIKRPQAEDILVDYSVHKGDNGALKIYDITVEGVSMITTQRSEFASVVSQKGIDYLIAQLAERSQIDAAKK